MIVAWRVVKEKHAPDAFSGDGARLYGGRWNHAGTRVVYVGGSLALAALELFVHVDRAEAALRFAAIRVEIPSRLKIDTLARADLPAEWRSEPAPDATRRLGTEWVTRGAACVLRVPSVIVPVEDNYLLNPAHPDFARLKIAPPEPFGFDPRVWK